MTPSSKSTAHTERTTNTRTRSLATLVVDLNCDSKIRCRNARLALVKKGQEAIPPLVEALKNGQEIVPLEAAKALGNIGGPQAIQVLIEVLEDERFEVRWEAAEALIKIGLDAVKPLLRTLIQKSDSTWMREGAHHVFSDMEDPQKRLFLDPVLAALDDVVPRLEVPVVAKKVLDELESK